jgi:hypothetical protein
MPHRAVQGLQLHPVSVAYGVSAGVFTYRQGSPRPTKKEFSYNAIYHHYRKWSGDGSLEHIFKHSILSIRTQINTQT